jgi:glycosyltransferase involved in cell wall biosynthesis
MARTLAGAALVALLSEYEAHPIAVLEALSIQRPVLVANTSGLRELGQQGLVRTVELNSTPQEIARAALHQIDESLVPAITALPTWDECASQLIQLYEEAVAVRRSACVF